VIEIGREQYRRVEGTDERGEVLLNNEGPPNGNVMVEARIYDRTGRLLATIEPDGLHEQVPGCVNLGGGPPG